MECTQLLLCYRRYRPNKNKSGAQRQDGKEEYRSKSESVIESIFHFPIVKNIDNISYASVPEQHLFTKIVIALIKKSSNYIEFGARTGSNLFLVA
jgi:hypothetical protein